MSQQPCKVTSLSIVVLISLIHVSLALNSLFEACKPKQCGGLNISYPFYIEGQQESFCGYPGYQVTCNTNNNAIIHQSNDSYAINQISYLNQTLVVINTIFLPTSYNCSPTFHNLTLDDNRFQFASNHSEVFFLQGCTQQEQRNLGRSTKYSCLVGDDEHRQILAAYAEDIDFGSLAGKCRFVVSVPYEGQRDSDIENKIKQGILLRWKANTCSNECIQSGGRCMYNQTSQQAHCFCPDGPSLACPIERTKSMITGPSNSNTGRSKLIIIISGTAAAAVVIVLLVVLVIYSQRRRSIDKFTFLWSKGALENQNVEAFLKSYGSLAPKRYAYRDIKKMTDSFKHRLGEGGYGHVYKGKLTNGRHVAVKVLKKLKGNGEEFLNEVVSISRTNHVNVVTLLGFCYEKKKRALIYEFMPKGSLEKFIHGAGCGQPLPCETLFNIAVGIAKGLDYLHQGCNTRILHFDIKPHNILLDDFFCPKISDFGLARLFPKEQSHISTLEARGTIGYIAPEVFCRNFGGVSHKSDVYSFGMMVIDMICGRTNTSAEAQHSSDMYFPQWIYNQLEVKEETALERTVHDEENKIKRKMILVSLWCIQIYPSNRPSMITVVEMLEGSLESLQIPPIPEPSSPLTFDSSSSTQLTT